MNKNTYAKQYLNFEIGFDEYEKLCGEKVRYMSLEKPIIVGPDAVKIAIQNYIDGKITKTELVDWVNVIWFSDSFEFEDNNTNSIVSVVDQLECMDEEGVCFTAEQFQQMISVLDKNEEFPCLYT